ncbi:MAG: 7-cyano-7-deazaguanine synthase QueC [Planctomycetota bacterium]|nr:7-cyano-7-deazaguanine synthase QueC [Planctomycetota bacterium]
MDRGAVVLLSGGLDSAVAGAWARAEGYDLWALTLDYGQRHRVELEAAAAVARHLEVREHLVLQVDLRAFGGSALTADIPVPKAQSPGAGPIPPTYVPARNTIFLSLALGLAEARGAGALVIGANAIDYSGYPDCRPAFLEAFERLAQVGTRAGVEGNPPRVLAPLIDLSKAGIVTLGHELGVPFERTHSCYDPDDAGRHCGSCDACQLRCKGFLDAGIHDPTPYAKSQKTP